MENYLDKWKSDNTGCMHMVKGTIMDRQFLTKRLLLLPGNNGRDNDTLLEMLRKDRDFRNFSGVEPTEKNILMFKDYLEINESCFYTIFDKEHPEKMIGYAGIGYQHQHFEVEFYISKPYRNKGYCTEALRKLCVEAFGGNLRWRNEEGIKTGLNIDKLYATTIADNFSAIKVLEKCGFIKNPEVVMLFQIFIDSDDDNTIYDNDIAEYVVEKNSVVYG